MSLLGIVVVVVLAIFASALLGAWLRGGSPQSDVKAIHEEMQRLLTAQAQGFSAQMGQVTQLVTQQLSEVRRDLEQGVHSSGQITADAQREVTEQLRNSTEVLAQLSEHLGEVQQSGRELTEAAKTVQAVLGKPKSRGVLGETQLHELLSDVLPASGYEFDHRFSTGAAPTAVLHAGRKLVAIDAEFPIGAFRQLVEEGEEERSEFAEAVRAHVDQVAEAFILPHEGTLDLALLFVPSESAFAELLQTQDEQGRLDDYCRQKHVMPVSPNSLHAYLGAVLIGVRGMEFEENAKRLLASLGDVKKQFDEFGRVHKEMGSQLEHTLKVHKEAGRQLMQALGALDAVKLAEATEEPVPVEAVAQVPIEASNNGG